MSKGLSSSLRQEHQDLKLVTALASKDTKSARASSLDQVKSHSRRKPSYNQYVQTAVTTEKLLDSMQTSMSVRTSEKAILLAKNLNLPKPDSIFADPSIYKVITDYAASDFYQSLLDSMNHEVFPDRVSDIALVDVPPSYHVGETYYLAFAPYYKLIDSTIVYHYDLGDGPRSVLTFPMIFESQPQQLQLLWTFPQSSYSTPTIVTVF